MKWLEARWYAEKPAPKWLLPLEWLYRCIATRRQRKAKLNAWSASVPVVVVGNINVGGTGKTPLTIALVALFKGWGYSPGIVSRGYKSKAPHYPYAVDQHSSPVETGDEPYLLQQRCACPVVIDPNRVAAAQYLLQHHACDLIISDDGLQHYALGRDIEIAVVDGVRGLGNGHCLPAGPLREKPSRLHSVDFVISNGDLSATKGLGSVPVQSMYLEPLGFRNCVDKHKIRSLNAFQGQTVHGLAGIGNPSRFFTTLEEAAKVRVLAHPMLDHQAYTSQDIHFNDDYPVLMTEKDAVKITEIAGDQHWYLEVSASLPDKFIAQLHGQLQASQEHKGLKNNG